MKLLRLVIVASVAFLLGAVPSLAWSRLDDFRGAKIQVLQTAEGYLNPVGWDSLARERLISSIDGTWIALSDLDLSTDVDLTVICKEKPLRLKKIDDYSFSMESERQIADKKVTFRSEYINREGVSYAVRNDFRARFSLVRPGASDEERVRTQEMIASAANQDAFLILLTPDVLMELSGQRGFPQLYGRCE